MIENALKLRFIEKVFEDVEDRIAQQNSEA